EPLARPQLWFPRHGPYFLPLLRRPRVQADRGVDPEMALALRAGAFWVSGAHSISRLSLPTARASLGRFFTVTSCRFCGGSRASWRFSVGSSGDGPARG